MRAFFININCVYHIKLIGAKYENGIKGIFLNIQNDITKITIALQKKGVNVIGFSNCFCKYVFITNDIKE